MINRKQYKICKEKGHDNDETGSCGNIECFRCGIFQEAVDEVLVLREKIPKKDQCLVKNCTNLATHKGDGGEWALCDEHFENTN